MKYYKENGFDSTVLLICYLNSLTPIAFGDRAI